MDDLVITQSGGGSYPRFLHVLRAIIGSDIEQQSLIDLCCHIAGMSRLLEFKNRVFVDVGDHSKFFDGMNFVQADVVHGDHEVFNQHYDVATCLDGIEHVHKPEGQILLDRMQSMADKSILFTPLDAWMIEPHNPDPESHKCLWVPEDLPGWAKIVFPEWHPSLGIGAFFFWKCADIEADFNRVQIELGELQ